MYSNLFLHLYYLDKFSNIIFSSFLQVSVNLEILYQSYLIHESRISISKLLYLLVQIPSPVLFANIGLVAYQPLLVIQC